MWKDWTEEADGGGWSKVCVVDLGEMVMWNVYGEWGGSGGRRKWILFKIRLWIWMIFVMRWWCLFIVSGKEKKNLGCLWMIVESDVEYYEEDEGRR